MEKATNKQSCFFFYRIKHPLPVGGKNSKIDSCEFGERKGGDKSWEGYKGMFTLNSMF